MPAPHPAEVTAPPPDVVTAVSTRMVFEASPAQIWAKLMFYEQIDRRPPLHLRLLLPVPIETTGRKTEVGDEAHCRYEEGFLVKRVTELAPGQRYAFEVIEQALVVGGGMKLAGGDYTLRELSPGRAELCIATRYVSAKRPRWLWRPIERAVCHSFHRHILRAMRREVAAP